MSDNKFDKKISEVLNGMEVPYEPGSWDALANKMDQTTPPPVEPSQFDEIMRGALSNLEASYKPEHWNILTQRLDRQGAVRRIRLHKVAEAAIVLLIAANFEAFINGGSRLFRMPVPLEKAAPEVPMAHQPHKKNKSYSSAGTIGNTIVLPSDNTTPAPDAGFLGVAYSDNLPVDHAVFASATSATPLGSAPTIGSAILDPNGHPVPAGLRPLTLLAALGLDLFTAPPKAPSMASTYTKSNAARHPQSHMYLLAAAGAYQHHLNDAKGYSTQFNTTEAGLRVGVRRGKWGAETGLAYAPQDYNTDTHVFAFYKKDGNTYGLSYDQIQADVVNVPLKVTRQVARAGRTRVHVTGGATAYIAAQKTAKFKSINYLAPPNSSQAIGDQPNEPVLKGAFQGGKLADNSYVTIDAGLRIEHKISPRTAAFIEPQYHRHIAGKGYGNEKSRIQAVGVQAGVMAAL